MPIIAEIPPHCPGMFQCLSHMHVLTFDVDTLTTSMLDSLGLIINKRYRTLICVTCGYSIDHNQVLPHFKAKHDYHTEISEHFATHIDAVFPLGLVYPPEPPKAPVPVVGGLLVPDDGRSECDACHKWYGGSFRRHKCIANPAQASSSSAEKNSRGNPVGPHPTQWFTLYQFFQVTRPESLVVEPMGHYVQYQRQLAAIPKEPLTVTVPDNHRVIQQFLKKEKWLPHVENRPAALLVQLYELAPQDVTFPALLKHVERYMLDSQNNINNFFFKRVIGHRPRTE